MTGTVAAAAAVYDCNSNGTLDACDLTAGVSVDCHGDGIPDECQVFGDFDGDEDVDLTDYATFSGCMTGPNGGPVDAGCALGDFDCDGDLDLNDFAAFQEAFAGSL